MHTPVRRFGRDDVEVTVDQQGTAAGVGPGEPGEDVAPTGRPGFDVLGLVADLAELLADPLRAVRLALGGLELAGVGGVEPDEGADKVDDLVHGFCHSHLSYHWHPEPGGVTPTLYHRFLLNHMRNTPSWGLIYR